MRTLQEAVNQLDPSLTDKEMLDVLSQAKVATVGLASGAEISGVLLQAGLLSLIEDQKNASGSHTALRNICLALRMRFLPDGQVDLSNPANVSLLDAFLAESAVADIMTAVGTDATTVKNTIMFLATSESLEFSNLRLIDIARARI